MSVRADAAGDYLTRTANLPTSTAYTAMGWARLQVDTNDFSTIFDLHNGSTLWNSLTTDSDGTSLNIFVAGGNTLIATLSVGTWFFWCIRCAGVGVADLVAFYGIGSASLTKVTRLGVLFVPSNMTLFGDGFGGELFNGNIAAVKIYDAALSDAEVDQERMSYVPNRFANLVLWSPFIDVDVVNFLDYSGLARNWTEAGTVINEDGPPITWSASPRRSSSAIVTVAGVTSRQRSALIKQAVNRAATY